MFSLGEIALILVVALIFLGPERLPEVARALGKAAGQIKRLTDDVAGQVMAETGLKDHAESLKKHAESFKKGLMDIGLKDMAEGVRDGLGKQVSMTHAELANVLKDIKEAVPKLHESMLGDVQATVGAAAATIQGAVSSTKEAALAASVGLATPAAHPAEDETAPAAPATRVMARFADDDIE